MEVHLLKNKILICFFNLTLPVTILKKVLIYRMTLKARFNDLEIL